MPDVPRVEVRPQEDDLVRPLGPFEVTDDVGRLHGVEPARAERELDTRALLGHEHIVKRVGAFAGEGDARDASRS